jgi:glutamate-5-semialdehyde dehydrogenase
MGHADGRCCAYVHSDTNLALARDVVLDSKIDYPAACNALETLLVHESLLSNGIKEIVSGLVEKGVELRCEDDVLHALDGVKGAIRATDDDVVTEFLDLKIYIRSVKSVDEGLPTPLFSLFLMVLQPSIISTRIHLTTRTQY